MALFICHLLFYHFNLSLSLSLSLSISFFCQNIWTGPSVRAIWAIKYSNLVHHHKHQVDCWCHRRLGNVTGNDLGLGVDHRLKSVYWECLKRESEEIERCPLPTGWAVRRPPPSSTTNNEMGIEITDTRPQPQRQGYAIDNNNWGLVGFIGFGFNWGWVFLVEFEVLDFEIRTMVIGKFWHLEKRERWKEEREEKYKLLKK